MQGGFEKNTYHPEFISGSLSKGHQQDPEISLRGNTGFLQNLHNRNVLQRD